jgi:hypothetical protein
MRQKLYRSNPVRRKIECGPPGKVAEAAQFFLGPLKLVLLLFSV